MMEFASINDSDSSSHQAYNAPNLPSMDDVSDLFNSNPYNPNEFVVNNGDSSGHWFSNDGLAPYTNDTDTSYLAVLKGTNSNCSAQMDFFLEMNKFYSPSQVIVPVIYSVICLVGLIANALVLFVIFGNKELTKSVANVYIANLAVADTLFLISLPFTSTQRVMLSWPFGAGMCKIVESVKYLNYFASIFFLTAMSIDRYIAVVHVVASSKWRTNRKTFFVCSFIWLSSFIMVIPLLIYTQVHGDLCALVFDSHENITLLDKDYYDNSVDDIFGMEYSDYTNPCDKLAYFSDYSNVKPLAANGNDELHSDYFSFDDGSLKNNTEELTMICKHPESKTFHVYLIFTFVIGFVIPFFIITVCYIMILARLLRPSEARARSKQAERTRRKVTRMVVALVITFFICWLPFYIWHLIQIRGVKAKIGVCHNVRDFTFCLGYANSCLNPILYTFLGHNFRERLRKSIAISFRSFSIAPFTKHTTNHTASRAETAAHIRKLDASKVEHKEIHTPKTTTLLLQPREEDEQASPPISCSCSAEKLSEA